jgi:hypothetical protein
LQVSGRFVPRQVGQLLGGSQGGVPLAKGELAEGYRLQRVGMRSLDLLQTLQDLQGG